MHFERHFDFAWLVAPFTRTKKYAFLFKKLQHSVSCGFLDTFGLHLQVPRKTLIQS